MIQIWDYMRNTNLNDPLLAETHHYSRKRPYGQGLHSSEVKLVAGRSPALVSAVEAPPTVMSGGRP